MTRKDTDIVADLRQALIDKIGSDRFDVWFENQADFSFENNQLTIFIHNEFQLEQVRRTFGEEIREVTRDVLGMPTSLSWQVREPVKVQQLELNIVEDNESAGAGLYSESAGSSGQGCGPTTKRSLENLQTQDSNLTQKDSRVEFSMVNSGRAALFPSSQATKIGPSGITQGSSNQQAIPNENCVTKPFEFAQESKSPQATSITRSLHQETLKSDQSNFHPSSDTSQSGLPESFPEQPTSIAVKSIEPATEATHSTIPTDIFSVNLDQSATTQRFRSFVRSSNTELAFTAASMIPRQIGQVSPLYLHGPTGSGKTHLLRSIIAEVRQVLRKRSVLLSAEQFTSGFLAALHGHGLPSFRRKHRSVDLLLIDDVNFFVGKRATLVELFHTIDSLTQAGKQIVLTSDRPPTELNGVGAEIVARLSAGLVCSLEYPEGEDRLRLTCCIAEQVGIRVDPSVLDVISNEMPGDARLIRGALNRLKTYYQATGLNLTADLTRRILGDLFQANQRPISIGDIERAVCDVFGVNGKQLRSDRKSKAVSQPRMLAMWLARKHTRAAFSEIGDYFGGRSHSTVISANKKVTRWVDGNEGIQVAYGQANVKDAIRRIETSLRAM